jgi:Holliday junction resolvasome RuvABC endonuclease subunit
VKGAALDLSRRNTGVVRFDGSYPAHTEEWSFQGKHLDYFGATLGAFEKLFRGLLVSWRPDWVAYEEVRPVNKTHMEQHFGMVGLMSMLCYRAQVPLLGVNTMRMRKIVLGNGRVEKADILERVRALYPGVDVPSHDVADAICVGLWFLSTQDQEPS